MEDNTTEYSFILNPSKYGVGVFAVHNIKKGTRLRLLGDAQEVQDRVREISEQDVPEPFQRYCIFLKGKLLCPLDFGAMSVGWYVNHSNTPNAVPCGTHWCAARDILAGEEVLVDYNILGESPEAKDDYYETN